MSADATLNIRLPKQLKIHGTQVLDRAGLGASQAVRRLYEYMEREQTVPECILPATETDKYQKRRGLLKGFATGSSLPCRDCSMKDIKDARLSRLIDGELS